MRAAGKQAPAHGKLGAIGPTGNDDPGSDDIPVLAAGKAAKAVKPFETVGAIGPTGNDDPGNDDIPVLGFAAPPSKLTLPPLPAAHDPIAAVQGLLSRLFNASAGNPLPWPITFEVIPADPATGNDVFELDAAKGSPVIRGNTGVALATGLNNYFNYYCNASVGWGRDGSGNNLRLPATPPLPPSKVRHVYSAALRYGYNVCTLGYSQAWWDLSQFQAEIDRMAMWGVNLPLAFIGQEYTWKRFFSSLGVNASSLADWFSGPAFLPWQRMNNMRAWGGPLDDYWIDSQAELQRGILAAMEVYGMWPVLPGWSGRVPGALADVIPGLNLTHNSGWAGFNSTYSADYLLEPTDPHFVPLGTAFYKMLAEDFPSSTHFYNVDVYNEMDPSSNNTAFLKASNAAVYAAMQTASPHAIFVMQGWLFYSSRDFWTQPSVEAYLSGVPDDRMLILDLFTEDYPQWSRLNSYYGKPWIWNELQVFGGRRGLYGNLTRIATGPQADRRVANTSMTGIGATPEAIEQNQIMFDLLWEQAWREEPISDLAAWVAAYAGRRYGVTHPQTLATLQAAWDALRTGAYFTPCIDTAILENEPSVTAATPRCTNATATLHAARLFIDAAYRGGVNASVPGPFRYDLVDTVRQAGVNLFEDLHGLQAAAWLRWNATRAATAPAIAAATDAMLAAASALDALLATDPNFMLGSWVSDALRWASTPSQAANRAANALNQITLWGPGRSGLNNYAAKHWAGLVETLYVPRWKIHSDALLAGVKANKPVNWTVVDEAVLAVELAWYQQPNAGETFPATPVGDALTQANALLKAFAPASPVGTYSVLPHTDSTASTLYAAWHTDPGVLSVLCNLDAACIGFNSAGHLKAAGNGTTVPASNVTLWLKA